MMGLILSAILAVSVDTANHYTELFRKADSAFDSDHKEMFDMKSISNGDYEQLKRILRDVSELMPRDNVRRSETGRKASVMLRKWRRIEGRRKSVSSGMD